MAVIFIKAKMNEASQELPPPPLVWSIDKQSEQMYLQNPGPN